MVEQRLMLLKKPRAGVPYRPVERLFARVRAQRHA